MFFKTRKVWPVIGVVVLVSWFGVGTVWSYLRTAGSEVEKTIRDAIPISFELKRLEQMTQDLMPEIRANQKVAAQLDVEVEYLEREIASIEQSQDAAKAEMQKLRDALKAKKKVYEFRGQSYSQADIEDDLARRLARYQDAHVRLEAKQRILQSRQRTLVAATDKIRQYRQQHDMLVEKAEGLQAELKLLELAQTTGTFEFDQSKLKDAKHLAIDVEKRIRTMQKLVDGEQQLVGEIPVEADDRSAGERFDEYFGNS